MYPLLLSVIMVFRPLHPAKPLFVPSPPPSSCLRGCSSMPPLKETYLQIQERNRREIRNRTYARLAQLAQEAENNRQEASRNQQEEETNTPLPTPSPLTSSTATVPLHTHSPSPSLLHIHINDSPETQPQKQDYRIWLIFFLLVLLLLGQFRFLSIDNGKIL